MRPLQNKTWKTKRERVRKHDLIRRIADILWDNRSTGGEINVNIRNNKCQCGGRNCE